MYKLGRNVAWVFLLGCGTASTPPAAGVPGPSPAPEPAAQVQTPAPEPAPAQPEEYEQPDETNPCEGTDLDLGSLAAQAQCNLDRTAAPLPKGLVASLSTESFSVIEGTESEIRLVLTNPTEAPMALEFDASCRFLNMLELAIFRKRSRIDRVSMNCDVDAKTDCSGHVIGVNLDPGGEAFVRVGIPARVALLGDKDCTEYPSRILSPGPYTVMLRTVFTEKPLTAEMEIRRLVRLPRKQCGRYAKKVADVAEPNAALRPGVAGSLAAQCKRKQPTQEFADCQLAAKTAGELQACGTDQ